MTSFTLALPAAPVVGGGKIVRGALGAAALAALIATSHTPARSQNHADCAGAEIAVRQKLLPLMRSTDAGTAWLVRNSIASARIARAYCHGDTPERGLIIYRRIADSLATWAATVETDTQHGVMEVERRRDAVADLEAYESRGNIND